MYERGDDAQDFDLEDCRLCKTDKGWRVWEDERDERGQGWITFRCSTDVPSGALSFPCGNRCGKWFDDPREGREYDEFR